MMLTLPEKQSQYLLLSTDESVTNGVVRLSDWRADVHDTLPEIAVEEFTMELSHVEAPLNHHQRRTLGVTALRTIELETAVETKVATDVALVLQLMTAYREQIHSDLSDVEIAAMVTAELAHWDVKRQNGSDYYTHVSSTAMVLKSAIELYGKKIKNDPERMQRMLFVALCHDSFEDLLRNDGSTYVNEKAIIPSMKFVKALYEALGRNDGDIAADMIFRISKTRQAGQKILQGAYEKNVLSDIDTTLIKLADNTHNDRLDPKGKKDIDPAILRKNVGRSHEYDLFRAHMLTTVDSADLEEQFMAHHIANVQTDDLRVFINKNTPKRPKDIIYSRFYDASQQ
ncbi:MAG: hypothetical protein ABIQ64_00640 [Candidatus Saccharimonadales bacterium]